MEWLGFTRHVLRVSVGGGVDFALELDIERMVMTLVGPRLPGRL
jgi:hypothetical protein